MFKFLSLYRRTYLAAHSICQFDLPFDVQTLRVVKVHVFGEQWEPCQVYQIVAGEQITLGCASEKVGLIGHRAERIAALGNGSKRYLVGYPVEWIREAVPRLWKLLVI
jgi:hypothetical protein